jgi:nitric oxide reductase NorQ protein
VKHESGVREDTAQKLVSFAEKTRNLKDRGLTEGASTRLLVHAGKLIAAGIDPRKACEAAVAAPLTDDHEMLGSLNEIINALF